MRDNPVQVTTRRIMGPLILRQFDETELDNGWRQLDFFENRFGSHWPINMMRGMILLNQPEAEELGLGSLRDAHEHFEKVESHSLECGELCLSRAASFWQSYVAWIDPNEEIDKALEPIDRFIESFPNDIVGLACRGGLKAEKLKLFDGDLNRVDLSRPENRRLINSAIADLEKAWHLVCQIEDNQVYFFQIQRCLAMAHPKALDTEIRASEEAALISEFIHIGSDSDRDPIPIPTSIMSAIRTIMPMMSTPYSVNLIYSKKLIGFLFIYVFIFALDIEEDTEAKMKLLENALSILNDDIARSDPGGELDDYIEKFWRESVPSIIEDITNEMEELTNE